ncbi:hypothetical protein L9F63_014077, partial [Diploptera punctata]
VSLDKNDMNVCRIRHKNVKLPYVRGRIKKYDLFLLVLQHIQNTEYHKIILAKLHSLISFLGYKVGHENISQYNKPSYVTCSMLSFITNIGLTSFDFFRFRFVIAWELASPRLPNLESQLQDLLPPLKKIQMSCSSLSSSWVPYIKIFNQHHRTICESFSEIQEGCFTSPTIHILCQTVFISNNKFKRDVFIGDVALSRQWKGVFQQEEDVFDCISLFERQYSEKQLTKLGTSAIHKYNINEPENINVNFRVQAPLTNILKFKREYLIINSNGTIFTATCRIQW